MPKNARKVAPSTPEQLPRAPVHAPKRQKLTVFLVTGDEALWPQIGAELTASMLLKQIDSVDELVGSTPSGQPGIVLWDARNNSDPAAVLSRMNMHSSRFAIVALDNEASANAWTLPTQHRQVVGHVGLPINGDAFKNILDSAHEEANTRMALLGDGSSTPSGPSDSPKRSLLVPGAIAAAVMVAAAAFYFLRGGNSEPKSATLATPAATSTATQPASTAPAQGKPTGEADEKIYALIDKAQQAMLDRHYIDPAAGSALSLYREVLSIDPANGEAKQGLERLAEILIARVQGALDDRKFDVALQSLETARSIDPSDRRLSALDERIASLRAELGPAQIVAAMNAQNFDRATQLIDEATRSKAIAPAKLTQLRDEVRRRRDEFEIGRLTKLIDLRTQQDHLIEPRTDSAVYYLEQARQSGAGAATLQSQVQELLRHLGTAARAAIDTRHFSDADKLMVELHNLGAPPPSLTGLQHDLAVGRAQPSPQKPDQPQFLELAQSRLAQGKLLEPDNDSALYYVNQLRSSDPRNAGLAPLSAALQTQILERARASFDSGDLDRAQSLAQVASGLGAPGDAEALSDKIRQRRAANGDVPQVPEQNLTRINKLAIEYPSRALQTNVEGWVEISYTVLADGSVANVKIAGSSPPKVFDSAASKAVSRLRYQPVMQNGSPVAVGTMLRVVFRVPK